MSDTHESKWVPHVDQGEWDKELTGHVAVCDRVRQDISEIKEDSTALVKHENTLFDFEVFSDGGVEGM